MTITTVGEETKLISGEELLAMGDIGPCELIDGRIVPMSPTKGGHGLWEARIVGHLYMFAPRNQRGWI